jgi:hypothetical protein
LAKSWELKTRVTMAITKFVTRGMMMGRVKKTVGIVRRKVVMSYDFRVSEIYEQGKSELTTIARSRTASAEL